MADLDAFRNDVRNFLDQNAPEVLQGAGMAMAEAGSEEASELRDARKAWLEAMADRGWTAPTWPKEYGGGGLSRHEAKVLNQEIAARRLPPPLVGMGLTMIGPTLLVHGSEEQKNEYLPKIISGEHRWCQGFSEPNAGSDLASLSCQAKREGDHYIINGQKTWTSGAQWANWIFFLVRTDESTKHGGITFLLSPMDAPGIEIRPIRLISGNSPFCETFFTDVKVPVENIVGGENNGWTVAKTLLSFERSGMGSGSLGGRRSGATTGGRIAKMAKEYAGEVDGKIADGSLRSEVAQLMLDQQAFQLTIARSQEQAKDKGAPGPETSILKMAATELGQRRDELLLRLRGTGALQWNEGADDEDQTLTAGWLGAKATTIYGGSSEIQRNIIAKRVLRLPQSK
ncbi:MAG: acyl-CoA dehydrogenase family protein [Myxococcales bacterium]|jgi:alkylation response protein AidB-like acyl-CoA dehydrogenase